ncbi:MAG: atpI [Chlamydiia bacterium]|nr:atpI [Chlamydiia bacterium]
MRVDVKKFLFIVPKGDQSLFFSEAQKIGIVEFINPHGKRQLPLTPEAEDYLQAIKTLRGYAQEEQKIKKDLPLAKSVAKEILNTKKVIEQTEDEIKKVEQEIELIAPFGNFSLEEIALIEKSANRKVHFYCAKSNKNFERYDENLVLIATQDGLDYFIAITAYPIKYPDLLEIRITEPLSYLKEKEKTLKSLVIAKKNLLQQLTHYNWLMHYAFVQELNRASYDFANSSINMQLDNTLFVIEGWVPINKKVELQALCSTLNIYSEEVLIEHPENIPTYLENQGLPRVGEDIVHIFDTPSCTDKDPSVWVLSAFAFFFAMIVGDAGYGLIFLLSALILKYKIKNLKGVGKRFLTLMTILGVTTICWGLLMSSFFSISLAPDNPIRAHSLINWLVEKKADYHLAKKDETYQFWTTKIPALKKCTTGKEFITEGNKAPVMEHPADKFTSIIMLELAIFVGAVHVIIGLLRYLGKNPIGAGWIAFIIGGYLFIPQMLHATSLIHFAFDIDPVTGSAFGFQLLCGGVAFAIIAAIFRNGLLGIFEIMTSIQILADILSYLRIYALGLAGSIVSTTINDMASKLPLFIAIIIIIFAHTLNIALSIMGGVIHGLRLNFLEWYHYSFEGGGKKFKPLQLHIFD